MNALGWGHAGLLWLLAALPLAAALRWWLVRRVTGTNAGIGAGLREHSASVGRHREALRAWLLWLGLAVAIAAAAGPRWGGSDDVRQASGADLLLVLDCSRSMLADDLYPNRMEAARRKAMDLLRLAPETRMALMPFAAAAVLRCPLTGDHGALETMLHDCSPDLFPAADNLQGTAIGEAVQRGLEVLNRQVERGQAVLVLSDGADDDKPAVEAAAKLAKERGVPVYGMFFGDPGREVRLVIDGKSEVMTADRSSLDLLATATGGVCVNATNDDADVRALHEHLQAHVAQTPWQERRRLVQSERYQWPLAAAIALIATGALLPTRRRRAEVRATPRGTIGKNRGIAAPAARAATVALLLLGLTGAATADQWQELTAIGAIAQTDPAAARQALEKLLLDHPDFHPASYDLGTLLLKDDAKAAATHLEAATASPQAELAADAWHNLALAYDKLGRIEDALAAATRAVQLRPQERDFVTTRDELVRVLLVRQDEARRKAEAEAKKLRLATTALPPAHVGEGYRQTLAARGGAGAPYRFSIAGDSKLPPGLDLAADGTLAGTPTAAGSHQLKILVKDKADAEASGTIALNVIPAPAITTRALPEAILGQTYTAQLASVGLDQPGWRVDGLPDGLALTTARGASATISGTPRAAGSFKLQVSAVEAAQAPQLPRQAKAELALTVSDGFAPDATELPPATAWAPYQHRLGVRGPAQRYQWKQPSPIGGLVIAADGRITGTADKAGELTLPVTIVGADGRNRDCTLHLTVNPPPLIEVEDPLALKQGQIVNRPLKVSGGTPPYQWHLGEGVLPKGLRLDSDGGLRGAPSETGDYKVMLVCADRWQATTQQAVTLKVTPPDPKDQQDQKDQKDQPKDQDKQDQKQDGKDRQDQAKQDQEKKDQQKDDKDQQGKDQQGKDPKSQDQAKQDQQKSGQQDDGKKPDESKSADEQQAQAAQQAKAAADAKEDADKQAATLNQAATDRWIEQLPAEDRGAVRHLLINGGGPAKKGAKPW